MQLYERIISSEVGPLTLLASDRGLAAVLWEHDDPWRVPVLRMAEIVDRPDHPILELSEGQLRDYFSGKRFRFDLPLDLVGSPFQLAVWKLLRVIHYGDKTHYGMLAARMGGAEKARAVGAAVGKNPVSIVIPCHRVVGKDGGLTGFAGGLRAKQFLLELEGLAASDGTRVRRSVEEAVLEL